MRHFWSYAAVLIAIPATISTFFVLNLWLVEYLERGRLRRRTDGRTSSLLFESFFVDAEIALIGGLVMMYYILHMPLSIRDFLVNAGQR